MNLTSFTYFKAVAEQRSFTRAAKELHVTQQTLSAHIASLERELGRTLVLRTNPLHLTHEGETFLAHARRIDADLALMQRELAGTDEEQAGTLRIGVAHTRGRVILPRCIARFCERYPRIAVDIREGSNAALRHGIAAGELDLAIGLFEKNAATGIEVLPFYRERVVLLTRAELLAGCGIDPDAVPVPLAAGDLSPLGTCPFMIGPPEDITGEVALRLIERAGFVPTVRARSSNMETLLALALQGVGACISPLNLVEATATPEQKRGLRIYDLGPDAAYNLSIALSASARRWKPARNFAQALQEG